MKPPLYALAVAHVMVMAPSAMAQPAEDAPPTPAEEPEADAPTEAPAEEPPAAPVVTVVTKQGGGDDDAETEEEEEAELEPLSPIEEDMQFSPRFRSGWSVSYGAFIPGPVHLFGMEGRAGFQINDLMCVYSGGGALFGFHEDYVSSDKELSFERTFGGFVYGHLMFEVTFLDTIFLALGPEIAWGALIHEQAYADTTQEDAGGHVSGFYGFLAGLKTRIGLGFGTNDIQRRKQFTFGFDGHLLFGSRYEVEASGGTTGVRYGERVGVAVGFMPSFSLGYDAK